MVKFYMMVVCYFETITFNTKDKTCKVIYNEKKIVWGQHKHVRSEI